MSGTPVRIGTIPLPTDSRIDGRIDVQKGAPSGLARLGGDGRVPEAELPVRLGEAALSTTIGGAAATRTAPAGAPVLRRLNDGQPVLTLESQAVAPGAKTPTRSGSFYWPQVIDARAWLGSAALDEYYLVDTTDHEGTHNLSGVWLRTAPTRLGPWTSRGRVFIDNTGGVQTETARVYPDPTGQYGFIMLYQQAQVPGAVGVQTTKWAWSNDILTWNVGGIAIDVPQDWPSDGHTGYAGPFSEGGVTWAHSLAGGGQLDSDRALFALSQSEDGRRFTLDPRPLNYGMDQCGDGRRIEWNSGTIVRWRGVLYWIGLTSDFVSGAAVKDSRIVVAPIADDLRHLIGKPAPQLYPPLGDENTNYRSVYAFVDRDGRLIVYYQCGNAYYAAEAI